MDWFTPDELKPAHNQEVLLFYKTGLDCTVYANNYVVGFWSDISMNWYYDANIVEVPDKWAFIIPP